MTRKTRSNCLTAIFVLSLTGPFTALAQTSQRAPLIAQAVDETKLVALRGNTRPEASRPNDRGAVADEFRLNHLLLQLKRSPEQEAALRKFLDDQQDPQSSDYHQWLTAPQLAGRFGVTAQDLAIIQRWLESHGFVVHHVHPNGMLMDFSGTAGQVRSAFHTEIHSLEVNGKRHIANMSDPLIPAALAPAIQGVVSLNDFKPRPLNVPRGNYTFSSGGNQYQTVVPGDLAAIYNFNPAFAAGYSGQGQTIVVLEDSDVYSTADFTTFRSTFGLTAQYPLGSLKQVHPSGGPGGACADPGVNEDDSESNIDVEWASAAAPNATIMLASCADTDTNFGGFIALQNLLAEPNPPSIVSLSFGASESELGGFNAYISGLYQTAAALGVSVFVSSGDEGAASSDSDDSAATLGITVSGFASTPTTWQWAERISPTAMRYNVVTTGADLTARITFLHSPTSPRCPGMIRVPTSR